MPTSTFTHSLFGKITFKTQSPVWRRGDTIEFLDGFNVADITEISVPQLKAIPGASKGKLMFHKSGHAQLLQAFADIEALGLLKFVTTCAGSLNFRLRKPVSGALSKLPSNHAFGIAIDLNSDDKALGASVKPVAPVFEALGFTWGAAFSDPMHFKINEFIAKPKSVMKHLVDHVG